MTPENFCYWLHGHLELDPSNNRLTEEQVIQIREHLALVFDQRSKGMVLNDVRPFLGAEKYQPSLENMYLGLGIDKDVWVDGITDDKRLCCYNFEDSPPRSC